MFVIILNVYKTTWVWLELGSVFVDQYPSNTKPVAVETLGKWVARGVKLGGPG